MYRGEWSYADVVAEKGPKNGAEMPVGKWARVVVCESKGKIQDWRAQWIQDQGSFTARGEVIASEEMVAKRELSR
ncbi:hypothetical protein CK203_079691 [Vitis vinifera]|uniref:Uncharacterized protein n=1 Tax=Vitis vinifera TaxID=29760 RepID=A0A438DL31_VITVI|nr:hypothetical protein CK203_079691 [Vitis vinifera]